MEVFHANNKPTNQLFNLSPLFSSTNNPIDIESVQNRLPGGSRRNRIFAPPTVQFPDSVTNAPTITTGSGSKTIGKIFMNDGAADEFGIRHTGGSNLWYTNGQSSLWFGSGIMDKPIGDFFNNVWDTSIIPLQERNYVASSQRLSPYFAGRSRGDVSIRFYRSVIPEPAEYALVFGLFAPAFVIVRRRFQKKELRNEQ